MANNRMPNTRTFMTSKQAEPPEKPKSPKKRPVLITRKRLPWLIIVLLLIICLFFYAQYRQAQRKLNGGQADNAKYQRRLEKLILLPAKEQPTVRTVSDAAKLHSQAFFKDAQNGDRVFIYGNARKAILYRPSTNMIVNVLPITPSPASSTNK